MTTDSTKPLDARIPLEVDAPSVTCRVIAVAGEIDAYTAPRLRECIDGVLEQSRVDHLVVDLSATTFLDSSALGVLVGALKRMHALEGRLGVVLPASPARRIFEITALDTVLALHDTRAAALSSAAA